MNGQIAETYKIMREEELVPATAPVLLLLGVLMAVLVLVNFVIYWVHSFFLTVCCKTRAKITPSSHFYATLGMVTCGAIAGFFMYVIFMVNTTITDLLAESEGSVLEQIDLMSRNSYSPLSRSRRRIS